MINTTRLLRRAEKYTIEHSGGRHQSGVHALSLPVNGDGAFLRKLRNGRALTEPKLQAMDNYLRTAGY